jgi:UDP-2-acetamido-2,6-beta-L-arabino-hexul-4-ose reductase
MNTVLVTGAAGFLGRNLVQVLNRRNVEVLTFDVQDDPADLGRLLARADQVCHLAGVNRPFRIEAFEEVNVGLTEELIKLLEAQDRRPAIVFASSTQAETTSPYGVSKRRAEEALAAFSARTGAPVSVYRLPGVFGKWCRPNYNSVVATFCHNIARGVPIEVSDLDRNVTLVHVQDVVDAFVSELDSRRSENVAYPLVSPTFQVTLSELASFIRSFSDSRHTLILPDMADDLQRRLYSTYVSYLPPDGFGYALQQRQDARGALAELMKQSHLGQIFLSRTKPGATRGNHYHDCKVEKFCVVEGQAVIRFLPPEREGVLEYPVSGSDFYVVDIPPGYAHSITNVGSGELVVLFWACEVFDPEESDTHPCQVSGADR